MNITETAKEVIRIANTAGLSKDVIDLLEKKLALLTGELEASARKISLLESRIFQLEKDNTNLRGQLENLQPVGFQESMGVLWKRTPAGFEPNPYCAQCQRPVVMTGNPPTHRPLIWICSAGHRAPGDVRPPST
jgi:hypothetical protein